MGEFFRVIIHYNNYCGYIEYSLHGGNLRVVFPDDKKRKEVEVYLTTPRTMRVAKTLMEFKESTFLPTENLDALKLALTGLWEATGVMVDWSRPVRDV